MPKLKLSYFDAHGGRGEVARLALSIGGVGYEDDRVPGAEWPSRKPSTPFGGLPTLEVDGQVISQGNAISRYAGRLADLYPSDPLQALLCDEILDAVEDIETQVGRTFNLSDEEKRAQRKLLVEGPLSFYLERIQRRLVERGGDYFAGGRLTIADLKVFVWVRRLKSGKLDHIPTELPERIAPKLSAHCERVRNHPSVQAYYRKYGVDA